jgi:hypothetical protein
MPGGMASNKRSEEPRRGHAPVRHDQRARDAERRKILRQFLQNPVPKRIVVR